MSKSNIGIIGGSGVYSMFQTENQTKHEITTPFGTVTYTEFENNNRKVYFLPRHGESHSIPPHRINFKANIFALFSLGVKKIISTNAVGSLKNEIRPGHFVIIDQFIDLVSGPITFFDGEFKVTVNNKVKEGVVHTDVTLPYSEDVRSSLIKTMKFFPDEVYHPRGCYVMFRGPRFETSAEISMFKDYGDVVGMTGAPEAILAKELEMEYASLNVVTNFAAGLQKEISHTEVIELFNTKVMNLQNIIRKSLDFL